MKIIRFSLLAIGLLSVAGFTGCAHEDPPNSRRNARVYNPETERFQRRPPYGERSNVGTEESR